MKKIIALSALLLVLLSCQSVLAAPKTIVAFGDSTTAPRGRTEVYATLLARGLFLEGGPVRVVNAGVGGHTTADAKKRFEKDVLEHNPDVVVNRDSKTYIAELKVIEEEAKAAKRGGWANSQS